MDELRRESPELDRRLRDSEPRRDLALALVGLRRNAGLTQTELAGAMGKDQAFVSRMESASGAFPSAASIEAYAQACNAAVAYVFASDGELVTVPLGRESEAALIHSAIQHAGDA
ncbi:helix-turn-helix domain-containing protein [Thauera phenolivorans]|uniref:helix-turn-helix domain-containing protein n=1 Tax=Thauera phenolivorans TaxID=1792543 RepID=UPI00083ABCFB|nr:helix-turn-helix transcriptional regulator [Thauera phenolivorans]